MRQAHIAVHMPDSSGMYRIVIQTHGTRTFYRDFTTRDAVWKYIEDYTVNAHDVAFTLAVRG